MNLFKKLLQKVVSDKGNEPLDEPATGKYAPVKELPVDERFMQNFIANNGKFIYCENMDEVHENFDNILAENDWYEQPVYCYDAVLSSRFSSYNLQYGTDPKAPFFFSQCESLIADTGAILLSSRQIKESKLHELPYHFIIFAKTSQLVNTISEGLHIIKNQCKSGLPSNITTIKNFEDPTEKSGKKKEEKDFMKIGSTTKNLYLLLLEDL